MVKTENLDHKDRVERKENGVKRATKAKRATVEWSDLAVRVANRAFLVLSVLLANAVPLAKRANAVLKASAVKTESAVQRVQKATRATVEFLERLAL